MNKQLLAVAFIAISNLVYAQTPNYDSLPLSIDFQQYCSQYNTLNCQEIAALFVAVEQLRNESGIVFMTEEQTKRYDELHMALLQEIAQSCEVGIKVETDNIFSSERNTENPILEQPESNEAL